MIAVIAFFIGEVVLVGSAIPFAFIKSDHPVSIVTDDDGRWFYYDFQGKPSYIIASVRQELTAKGYKEDFSNRPWYRFTNGKQEVIVCDSDEIALSAKDKGKPIHFQQKPPAENDYIDVWVKEPGKSSFQTEAFRIKKTILGW